MENSPLKRSFNKNRKSDESSAGRRSKNVSTERGERKSSRPFKSRYQEVEEKISRRKSDLGERKYRDDDYKPRGRSSNSDEKPRRSFKEQGERPRRSFADRDERPRRSFKEQDERPRRSFTDRDEKPRRSFKEKDERPRRSFTDRDEKPRRNFADRDERPRRSFADRDEKPRRSFKEKDERPRRNFADRDERPRRSFKEKDERPRRNFADRDERPRRSFKEQDERPRRSFADRDEKPRRSFKEKDERPRRKYHDDAEQQNTRKKRRDVTAESPILSEIVEKRRREGRSSPQKQKILSLEYEEQYGPIRLNKYISNSGICSRRDADVLISSGAIMVNGEVVTELGAKIMPTDEVRFEDKILQREKPVYLLLNKPKDYITTTYDERDRHDVMELVRGACKERIYPIGRLDKDTTGVLLFTNDGEMTKKLTHPKHNIRKTYHVELDKKLSSADFETILNGIELQDGEIKADDLAYVGESKKEIGITIHSGRNRIVRRIFETLGYEIVKLDRVVFAGLDKKNVLRGKWRFLTQAEINILKML